MGNAWSVVEMKLEHMFFGACTTINCAQGLLTREVRTSPVAKVDHEVRPEGGLIRQKELSVNVKLGIEIVA